MPRIALKIEVPSYRAACVGVPLLTDMLRRHRAGASFVFALGPDRSGRALGHAWQPQLHGRAINTSLIGHFGLRPLLYGTLLPAPHIGSRCADILRRVRDDGFEVGLHGWDALRWLAEVDKADAGWSETQLKRAMAAFEEVFSTPPLLHAAAGWRGNPHSLRLTQRCNFAYASDTRGRHPFVPVWHGEIVRCPQIPTTLPTLDELADAKNPDPQMLRDRLLALTATPPPADHVFTLRVDPGATQRIDLIEELLTGWREQGYELTSIQALAAGLDVDKLPRHEIVVGQVAGRHGTLLLQGNEFLSDWRQAA
ncbi:MAG: 4-deoxy-4-formamido-L-arabinose-phosphoundecaprenol deformylase [Gammaproteobacteria bacterium]|nr:4-deoxy-4-formamido-L-arabinose-phosphoundecaprenol deformylase [Rhodocyclaceae bacterium]MBU3909111.1 4-deoxy-4-formamido-L-arabinose-phosphoundecaprenol deformylase [Gammaproteobacteria bacterium]MBU4003322.1 4-deoxy-4-formamido-L-arabinose-phosphoundecaprenol deformylase [Gammaproteobacteria bacterium]MBU4022154.1 4-deoxy-4-formamido-L-arabinose-phosphoundecaprenol deformylase [Gammaproteobacteria bacterium]MBU4096029.1 4-deoxy-4-formamido-L-arabinose-phosphoundecaprenol deformylase [Gamm